VSRHDGDGGKDLRVLDAVVAVREHPEWFFRRARFNVPEMVAMLVDEARLSGAVSVWPETRGDWVLVRADVDWLKGDLNAFQRPVSYPEAGQNSSRVEVVLTAFCRGVITKAGHLTSRLIVPQSEREPDLDHESSDGRVIAFLPPESAEVPPYRGEPSVMDGIHSYLEKV